MYKTKEANLKHANFLYDMGSKLIWGVLAAPLLFLTSDSVNNFNDLLSSEVHLTFMFVFGACGIWLQSHACSIIDEFNENA